MRLALFFVSLFFYTAAFSLNAAQVAVYSESADVFELMDNVSGWHPSTSKAYRRAWERKFPITSEDKARFSKYSKIREKFAKNSGIDETSAADVFGKNTFGYDLFSEAFYTKKSIGEALKKLSLDGLSPSELSFLRGFYKHYKTQISFFVSESTQFAVKLLRLNKMWKTSGIDKVLKKITPFILGRRGKRMLLVLRPVWWPSSEAPQVIKRGPFLILRYHPLAHSGKWNMDDIAEKAVLSLIQAQSVNQRQNLTKIFEARCRGRSIELQESLKLLFSKMLPEAYKSKKNFDLYKRWSKRSFTDLMVKLLFPLMQSEIKSRGDFAGRFMTEASNICRSLNRLAITP